LSGSPDSRLAEFDKIRASQEDFNTRLAALEEAIGSEGKVSAKLATLDRILKNQERLGKRFLGLLILPFLITMGVIILFYVMRANLADVSELTQELTIERFLTIDNNYAMAIDQYEQLDKKNETPSILARLGVLYFDSDPGNNKTKAIQALEMAKRLNPKDWMTYRYLTYIYVRTGDEKNAIVAGEFALKLNKYDAATYNNLAWVYAFPNDKAARNLERAEEYAKEAAKLTGEGKPEILETLARIEFLKGEEADRKQPGGGEADRKQALSFLRKAIAFAPTGETKYKERLKSLFPDDYKTLFPDEKS
jgi:tetratricopeptide (TPR) repeat protein